MRDIAIDEIREVRHRMSAECGHDVDRFFAMLKEEEKQFAPQIKRWRDLEKQYQQATAPQGEHAGGALALREKPKSLKR